MSSALRRSATVAPGPPLQAEIVDLAWAERRADAWQELAARAAYPNPFLSVRVLRAHADHGLVRPPRLAVVREAERWVALAALLPRGGQLGLWRRVPAGFASPYAVNGTPLIRSDTLEAGAAALLQALTPLGPALVLPRLALASGTGRALAAAAERGGTATAVLDAFERPMLVRRGSHAAAVAHLSAGRRRRLRRLGERLAEIGPVSHRAATAGAPLREAVDAFLTLEAQGWKGRSGTALARHAWGPGFARALFDEAGGKPRPRADLLLAGERVVAVSLSFVANGTAHLWKIAHDEALRRDAPGLVLEEAIIRACHETGFADRLDSLAQPGSVLDELYPDREAIGDLVIGLDPALDPARLQRWAEAEQSRRDTLRRFKTIARTTRDRLLALRPPR